MIVVKLSFSILFAYTFARTTIIDDILSGVKNHRILKSCIEKLLLDIDRTSGCTPLTNIHVNIDIIPKIIYNRELENLTLTYIHKPVYIFDIRTSKLLSSFLWYFKNGYFEVRAFYIVILPKITKKFLNILAQQYACNLYVIQDDFRVFTYFPYRFENILEPDLAPVYVGSCLKPNQMKNTEVSRYPKLWRNSTIRTYERVVFPFITENGRGIEQRYLKDILNKFGITLKAEIANYTFQGLKRNGTYDNEGLKKLYDRRTDMVLGKYHAIVTELRIPKDFDASVVYMLDNVHFIVPVPTAKSYIAQIFSVLNLENNYTLILLIIFWCLFVSIVYKESFGGLIFLSFRIIHGIPVPSIQRYKFRFLLSIWLLCLFVCNLIFQSFLVSIFPRIQLNPDMDSEADIINSKLPIKVSSDIYEIYRNSRAKDDVKLFHMMYECIDYTHCIREICQNRSAVTIRSRVSFLFTARNVCMNTTVGNLKIHIGPQIRQSYNCVYFSKGYPAFDVINDSIKKLVMYGGILTREMRNGEKSIKKFYSSKTLTNPTLTFKKLKAIFYIHMGLLGISVCIFAVEMIIGGQKVNTLE
ncbi:hypothetical protein GWI33_017503 [Rhynchophorus ferrugineus]|uniref:Ionotropic receptor n=1 Tax=Rhynchophorus ferrugineus TaxID=354439 RepID=A0A834HZ34_RHYFE|nr:hypothetical protein GWI33_017503 [Rhynchophorus ferrugineus]